MNLDPLQSISPIDGRYHNKTSKLSEYFSEYALFKYRILVEIEYFIHLAELKLPQLQKLSDEDKKTLRAIYKNFEPKNAAEIKEIEKTTNHDIKATEYYIKENLKNTSLKDSLEFIHFGLTSQDINNTSIPLMIKDAVCDYYIPELEGLIKELHSLSTETKSIAMLAKTHGQPASPTTLGKEIFVFVHRLNKQLDTLKNFSYMGKFGGATGNFNAHIVAYHDIKWDKFAEQFLKNIGLERNTVTTQIDSYDNIAELCHTLSRINTIIIDLDRDVWQYISQGYFGQKTIKGEIGSSAMPHKVNPIDFENSEGNLGFSNSMLYHFSQKLPISRLQRDLTDSTVLRNIGMPLAYTSIAVQSTLKGLSKLKVNKDIIEQDLNNHVEVLAEAIQTVLRREGEEMPYEKLKDLTRGKKVTMKDIHQFVESLGISDELKNELKKITPSNYIGMATNLVE